MGIRGPYRNLVSFQALDAGDFELPAHIDKAKMDKCIAQQPVPYWRNAKYRMMCRWWIVHMPRYVSGYDYVMRLDDDSFIEEPIKEDLFKWAAAKDLVYASNLIHTDCGVCCYGMDEFFEKRFPQPEKQALLKDMFVKQDLCIRTVQYHPLRALLSITLPKPLPADLPATIKLAQPVMYYNNFHITRPAFWLREDVQETIREIDATGNIFYYRWGDSPLQSAIVLMHAKTEQVSRCKFKYSKRLQREAFYGDDKKYWSYMPAEYTESSCITGSRPRTPAPAGSSSA